jgi:hypothetical protein
MEPTYKIRAGRFPLSLKFALLIFNIFIDEITSLYASSHSVFLFFLLSALDNNIYQWPNVMPMIYQNDLVSHK